MAQIAVDKMGSDLGPAEVVQGAAQLSLEPGDIEMVLVGDQAATVSALMAVAQRPKENSNTSGIRIDFCSGITA